MNNTKNTFERLAENMSISERHQLLEKINTVITPDNQSLEAELSADYDVELSQRMHNESIFLRILLAIKSFFSRNEREEEYNAYLVKKIAKSIENKTPNILSYKRKILLTGFYQQLERLYEVSGFMRPGIIEYEENEGSFYAFLGSLILDDLNAKYDTQVNPRELPLEKESNHELRASLHRKLDEVLTSISSSDKGKLYVSVKSIRWLKEFVNLPFKKCMHKFMQLPDDKYHCSIESVKKEIDSFASVFCNARPISSAVIEALFLFFLRSSELAPDSEDAKNELEHYLSKSMECLSAIKEFQLTVNMHDLGIITHNDARWFPLDLPGVEDWFVKFKNEWRRAFDKDWSLWLHIKKNQETKNKIEEFLDITGYPLFPNRPWQSAYGGTECKCEYTVGFLYIFYEKLYPRISDILKIIMVEGEFFNRDFLVQFTDVYNNFNNEQEKLGNLNNKLKESGEWGERFMAILKNSVRTIQGQTKINVIMIAIEAEVQEIVAGFGKSCRTMNTLLNCVLNGDAENPHGIVTNLEFIRGLNKQPIRDQVAEVLANLSTAYNL
ncbi:MAG TPA: DUF5312 family protein, partial [Treponemataceae bacterium]|nr:DUF5312 family protein [Treponemataceae bacterium]